jgi:hypothetical protein
MQYNMPTHTHTHTEMVLLCIEGNADSVANAISAYQGMLLHLMATYTCNVDFTPHANRALGQLLLANYWALTSAK